jgi:hypothetical protein
LNYYDCLLVTSPTYYAPISLRKSPLTWSFIGRKCGIGVDYIFLFFLINHAC